MSSVNIAQYLSNLQSHVPSLCIPRVFENITEERIFENFKALNLGCIERIEMYPKVSNKGEKYKKVVIHLLWNLSENACRARYNVLNGKDFKITYEKQWFWTVFMNKNTGNQLPIAPLLPIYERPPLRNNYVQ